jgi:hypothetical protein
MSQHSGLLQAPPHTQPHATRRIERVLCRVMLLLCSCSCCPPPFVALAHRLSFCLRVRGTAVAAGDGGRLAAQAPAWLRVRRWSGSSVRACRTMCVPGLSCQLNMAKLWCVGVLCSGAPG